MVDFKVVDINGQFRHVTIPASQFNEDTMTDGIAFDASNYGYAVVEKSDMVFIPDLDTAVIDPYCEIPTLSMTGNAMIIDYPNNCPLDQYPRNIVADATMLIKYVIHNTKLKYGKVATFMPKPVYGEAGNGMHVHMLLLKDGEPVFSDDEGYSHLSKEAHYFMGGLLKHIGALCAITNPSTNSFKRLVPGFEAPVTVGYATSNRSAVIRIPAYAKEPSLRRFEIRNPDATCNPYLCYAALLMAGLDGIKNKIDPHAEGWGPYDMNLYSLSHEEKAKLTQLPTPAEIDKYFNL